MLTLPQRARTCEHRVALLCHRALCHSAENRARAGMLKINHRLDRVLRFEGEGAHHGFVSLAEQKTTLRINAAVTGH